MDRLVMKSAEESVAAPLPNRPARMLIARRHARLAITSRVFVKIASGRAKPFWVEAAFALGKHHPFGFSAKLRQDGKNLFGWRPILHWASTTRLGFRQNHAARMPIARRFIRLASTAGTAQSVFRRRPVFCRRRTGATGRRESPGIVRSAPAALFRSRT